MNKSKLLISSCILCALSNSALADMDIRGERTSFYERNKPKPLGFNYTYLEANYINSTVDSSSGSDNKSQSLGGKISFAINQHVAGSLEVTGSAYTLGTNFVESLETYAGGLYFMPVSKTMDVYAGGNIISIEFTDPDTDVTADASGFSLVGGMRQRINSNSEWGAKVSYFDIDDDSFTRVKVAYKYGADDKTQYILGYETTNTDDKQTAINLGIRFNF